jgi:hypothetical protein
MTYACPVCDSGNTRIGEQRSAVPVLMNKLYESRVAARTALLGPLEIVFCQDCGFTWNAQFDPDLIAYDESYENDQTHSPEFQAHVEARAADVISATPAGARLSFLEIGCGQGTFIGEVARSAGTRLSSAEGFDPAWRGADASGPAGSRIHKVYFNESSARRLMSPPNVVATRHTIEHVPEPVGFLFNIRQALGPASRARLFVETPSVTWILRHEAIQDFFYEHCTLFTAPALAYALRRAGFHVLSVDHVFGGQYLWARAEAAAEKPGPPPKGAGIGALAGARSRFVDHWRALVQQAGAKGPVAIWGAGAKGVSFATLIDPDGTLIDHAIDINPAKQGRWLAGSGIPVLSPEDAAQKGLRSIFLMNPIYHREVRERAAQAGLTAEIIPLNKSEANEN